MQQAAFANVSPSSIIILTSVLLLVVIELSKEFHEDNLKAKAIDPDLDNDWIGNLGIFSGIHMLNFALLSMGGLWGLDAYYRTDQVILLLLVFIYLIMIVILPFLEIEAYEEHVKGDDFTASIVWHMVYLLICSIGVLIIAYSLNYNFLFRPYIAFAGIILLVFSIIVGPSHFLKVLKEEYRVRAVRDKVSSLDIEF